ncbi:MAG: hypothetical protein IAG13_38295 [Deltaproteobacteria bacterium]|nr:hypothetical protein [Nannocystaceae bacterium]
MKHLLPIAAGVGFAAAIATQPSCTSQDEGGARGFCARLSDECELEPSACEDVLELDDIDNPGCDELRDDLFDCAIAQPSWACPDTSTLYAGASWEAGGRQYWIDGYSMWLPPSCDWVGDAWQRCNTCGPGDTLAPREPPAGSYSLSCRACTMSGSTLSCECDGYQTQDTSIDVCGCIGDIANSDGTLCCDEGCQ